MHKREDLLYIYELLFERFGNRNWWPADHAFEVCVGAILTQNTAWKNVVKAITNLKIAGVLSPEKLHELGMDELAMLIRPAGYYNVKAKRLKAFISHLADRHALHLDSLFDQEVQRIRDELLGVHGIGKETADSMILYAGHKPIFVIDAYTKRVLMRHGFIAESDGYDDIQDLFHSHLERDLELYKDFHAQFVAVGFRFCKPKPVCEKCPLNHVEEYIG